MVYETIETTCDFRYLKLLNLMSMRILYRHNLNDAVDAIFHISPKGRFNKYAYFDAFVASFTASARMVLAAEL